eukprot:188213-Lingulodinium_polyedra.AAC.1
MSRIWAGRTSHRSRLRTSNRAGAYVPAKRTPQMVSLQARLLGRSLLARPGPRRPNRPMPGTKGNPTWPVGRPSK